MTFEQKTISLKDGRTAILRSPVPGDAAGCLEYMKRTAAETPYLLRTPDEITMTTDQEADYLQNILDSDSKVMILCLVDGEIAGSCSFSREPRKRTCHRGSIGIALTEKYWGLGIGTAMLLELLEIGRAWGLTQAELQVFEGNQRAIALYRKVGFETASCLPNAIRMPDGTFLREYTMIRPL